jgi:hypothetical protein
VDVVDGDGRGRGDVSLTAAGFGSYTPGALHMYADCYTVGRFNATGRCAPVIFSSYIFSPGPRGMGFGIGFRWVVRSLCAGAAAGPAARKRRFRRLADSRQEVHCEVATKDVAHILY